MSYVISFMNVKGGVGKTTIAFNLAHALRMLKRRILLIDLDLQENLSDKSLANPKEVNYTVYDLITKADIAVTDCLYDTVIEGVKIIPSEIEIVRVKKEMDPASNPDILFRLRDRLEILLPQFDYILIDLHPDVDLITTMALMASTHYLIPVKPDTDSIKGLRITDEYVNKLLRANKQLKELGVLLTDFDKRTSLANTFHESLQTMLGPRLMNTVIRRNVAITAAAVERKTIFQYDIQQSGCVSFRSLAKEVIAKCENIKVEIGNEEVEIDGQENND